MKITKRIIVALGIMMLAAIVITACQKNVTSGTNPLTPRKVSVYLTDDPCQYDSVFIDIRYVEVKIDTSIQHMDDDQFGDNDNDRDDDQQHRDQFGKWDTLSIRSGVYNISKLRNGIDTLLGTANIPIGKIRKIRLTLGTNNSVTVAGVSHPLSLFPGTNNYVYIKIHKEDEDDITTGQTSIWIDFDICESVKLVGGQYFLKPFLKPFGMNQFGKIEGKVLPNAAHAIVTARNVTDSGTAIPENDGEYRIRGLRQGTYNVTFKGSAGYRDTTVLNIQVQNGQEKHIPAITLHQ